MIQLPLEVREDLQGIITSGYSHLPDANYLILRFEDGVKARAWLKMILPEITTAKPWRRIPDEPKIKPDAALNIAFSYQGFETLGLSASALGSFEREYVFGMVERAEVLGDDDQSAPPTWEFGYPNGTLHCVLAVFGKDEACLKEWTEKQMEHINEAGGITVVSVEPGHRYRNDEEQFGFKDGVSQPDIEGIKKQADPGQELLDTGEFILGYKNSYGCLPPTIGVPEKDDPNKMLPPFPEQPTYRDFGRNGSYIVYRKLEQDVAGLWNYIQKTVETGIGGPPPSNSADTEAAMLKLGAKFVGRWRSGAPLVMSPNRDDPTLGTNDVKNNDFCYEQTDANGYRCPFAAHIRRVNPRDSIDLDSSDESVKTSNRHRMMRRGLPYGPRLVTDTVLNIEDDGRKRGLQFFAIVSQIKRQFEFVQQQWVNNAQFNGMFNDKDPVIGNNDSTGNMTLQREIGRETIPNVPRFVTTRGGGYFFVPSMTSLKYLASL